MYLSDRDIKKLLPELGIETPNEDHPFDADKQIQPASIDLRLSNVFWRPSRRRAFLRRPLTKGHAVVDLRQAHMEELDPRRDWRRIELDEGDSQLIAPGRVLMGRIYERFAVPSGYAGKVEGRSSYARLGLFVHCSGDFINPGWDGYMPLQLFNAGPYTIRITPYVSVCQLKLVPLSSEPERSYGMEELESKYVNDDGGPSFWWRDRQVRELQKRLGEAQAPIRLQQEVVDLVRFEDPELLARFQKYVGRQKVDALQNADDLVDRFSKREARLRMADRASIGAFLLAAGATVSSFFVSPITIVHVLIWLVTLVLGGLALGALVRSDGEYLGAKELVKARARQRPTGGP